MQGKDGHREGKGGEGRKADWTRVGPLRAGERKTLGSGAGHWDRLMSSAEKWRQVWDEGEPRLQIWGQCLHCVQSKGPALCLLFIQALIQVVRAEATKLLKHQR